MKRVPEPLTLGQQISRQKKLRWKADQRARQNVAAITQLEADKDELREMINHRAHIIELRDRHIKRLKKQIAALK